MVKVLRKYNKWFLAVGGSLLMVTFLVGGDNNPFAPDQEKVTVAEVMGKPVSRKELGQSSLEFDALKSYVPAVLQAQFGVLDNTHWLLLVREAENAGLVAESRDGSEWLTELAQSEAVAQTTARFSSAGSQFLQQILGNRQYMQGQTDELLKNLTLLRPRVAASHRLTEEQFDHALSRLRGVARLINSYYGAARLSDRMVIREARQVLDAVLADAVIIPADRVTSEVPEPTEAQLLAHFEQYQKAKPGEGEHGIGYILPERVKLEWMEVDAGIIASLVKPDPIAVNKEFQLNRDKYPGEFSTEKAKIEQALIKAKTEEIIAEIDRVYKARVRSATRRLEADGPLKKLPADWASQRPTMEALAAEVHQAVEESQGLKLPAFTVTRLAERWTRIDDVGSLTGIGGATLRLGTRSGSFEEILYTNSSFDPKAPFGLQTLLPFESALEAGANRYYFCILDTKGQAAAESLDEVRPRAISDYKRLAAFEKLKAEVPQLLALTISDGLDAVAKSYEQPAQGTALATGPLGVIKDLRISRANVGRAFAQPDANTSLLDVAELREQVVSGAEALGVTTEPNAANTAARTSVVPLPKALAIAVVQSSTPLPMAKEDLRMFTHDVVGSLLRREQRDAAPTATDPFTIEALKKRLGYKSKGDEAKS